MHPSPPLPADDWLDATSEVERLVALGPRARAALTRLADRGDWRLRVLAISGLGRLARLDPHLRRRVSLTADLLARVPRLRKHLPTVGRGGRLVVRTLHQSASAPLFAVRTAAALALGEYRRSNGAPVLRDMLRDPFPAVRRAAAVALAHQGVAVDLADLPPASESTPTHTAEGDVTLGWLGRLVSLHRPLFDDAKRLHGLEPDAPAASVAEWLAGPTVAHGAVGVSAEAQRYDHEVDLAHHAAKPFGSHDLAEGIRQLDALTALVANLRLPRGARVVDLGGGSGWAAILLAQFGYRPITVDVAMPLLKLAVTALGPRGGHVVAGDMTAVPLGDATVDAIVVIDALHHVADHASVLREAFRILRPGGAFLVAEPGEGHSESAKSLAESKEQGVRESEVSPLALARLASRAGFDDAVILPRVTATAQMRVADLRAAMSAPVESWPVNDQGTHTTFDALVLRTMLARPLLVFRKGGAVPDSRAPGRLLAEIAPALHRDGASVTGAVQLRNVGDSTWLTGDHEAGAVSLGLQLLTPDGRMLQREWHRERLPRHVGVGESCSIPVRVTLPDETMPFQVKLDLVAEQVCWFEDRGSRAAIVAL